MTRSGRLHLSVRYMWEFVHMITFASSHYINVSNKIKTIFLSIWKSINSETTSCPYEFLLQQIIKKFQYIHALLMGWTTYLEGAQFVNKAQLVNTKAG